MTEAAFRANSLLWITFLLIALDLPVPQSERALNSAEVGYSGVVGRFSDRVVQVIRSAPFVQPE